MNDEQQTITYPADHLRNFATEVFMYFGVPKTDAEQASDVLAKSDLRGIDSHGIARLHTYFEMLELGRINPRPKIQITREKASVASIDGDNGLGLVVGPKANAAARLWSPDSVLSSCQSRPSFAARTNFLLGS